MLEGVWRKGNSPTVLVGMYIGVTSMENSMEFPLKKKKSCHVIQQSHSWVYIQRKLIPRDACSSIFIAALFIIAKTWKQPKCPSTDEWIEKMWDIYTMDC